MKSFFRFAVLVVFLAGSPFLAAEKYDEAELHQRFEAEVLQAEIPKLVPTPWLTVVSRSVVQTLQSYHYSRPRMTPELCSQWYLSYFQTLDPQKIYFLQSDLEEFRSYEDATYERERPNLEFAFLVYTRFLERLREWAEYSFRAYENPCDFTREESMTVYETPEEHPWPATEAEREDLWRQRVKNALLTDQLQQEERAARQAEKTAEDSGEGKPAVYTPPPIRFRARKNLINLFQNRLKAEPVEVIGYFLNALTQLMDPHTCYFAPEQKEDFEIAMSLTLQGIGATLSTRDSYTVIVSLVPGGPAAKNGRLRPGDKILAVAQSAEEEPVDVVDMPLQKVVQQIRGPKGTEVFLTIQPEGASTEYVLRLERDEIQLKDAEAQSSIHLRDGKRILCIYLPSFYRDFKEFGQKENAKSTTVDVLRLLHEAQKEGPVDGLILDMRGNGGGSLEETIELTSAFLKKEKTGRRCAVVQTRTSDGKEQVRNAVGSGPQYSGPLMVMVDRGAASATEILAACLQDCRRAVIVGDPETHGKGSVQAVLDMSELHGMRRKRSLLGGREPGSLKITIQKFYRVTGGSTQRKGVTPDICFPSFFMAFHNAEKDLPHALPWDEIFPAYHSTQTNLEKFLPVLQDFYHASVESSPAFQRYSREVAEYLRLHAMHTIPLEIEARRGVQERELSMARRVLHYQPDRNTEPRERLHDAGEELYDDGAPREDVLLDASLALMGKMIELDSRENGEAFSLRK